MKFEYVFLSIFLGISSLNLTAQTCSLNLETALDRAFEASPALSIAEADVGIAEADTLQAGLLPNPEFIIEYDGDPAFNNRFESPEVLYGLSQEFDLLGKRRWRRAAASALQCRAEWELRLIELELYRDFSTIFIQSFAAQEKMMLVKETVHITQEMVEAIAEKRNVGKVSPIFVSRAILNHAATERELSESVTAFNVLRRQLASYFGTCAPDFDVLEFPLYELCLLPPPPDPCSECGEHASVIVWDAEIEAANKNIRLQKLERIPNITVSAGVVHEGRFDETSGFFALNFPIPIFDSNQAGVARSYHEKHRAEENRRKALLEYQSRLGSTYQELKVAFEMAQTFKNEILVLAQESFNAAEESYKYGRIDYIELLEAKRTLFEIRQEVIDAFLNYHTKKLEYDFLENKNEFAEEKVLL